MDTPTHPLMPNSQQDLLPPALNELYTSSTGPVPSDGEILLVWGHGWQQDHSAFAGLIASLPKFAHLAVDFPGFGRSPRPQSVWGTAEYADAMAVLLEPYRLLGARIVWIGHSFGGRIGLQLAARHPSLIDRMCIIAGAGLPRTRTVAERTIRRIRALTVKTSVSLLSTLGIPTEALKLRFGSVDYRNAGPLRPIFVRVVNEDLTGVARKVVCPVLLVYGANDDETPPEFGQRFANIIPKAELSILQNQDHYSLLAGGRHLVLKRLIDFLHLK